MSEELKPCPFCGEQHKWIDCESTEGHCKVLECHHLYIVNEAYDEDQLSRRTALWNTRPIEDALRARVEELEAKTRWIPVSEGLPKDGVYVHVIMGCMPTVLSHAPGAWHNLVGWPYSEDAVTHWMPLPEPPERAQ